MSFDIDPADERTQLDECIAEIKRLKLRLEAAEKVCKAAKWVMQDPALTHTDCSSEPWEQSHDSRDDLGDDLKAWQAIVAVDSRSSPSIYYVERNRMLSMSELLLTTSYFSPYFLSGDLK